MSIIKKQLTIRPHRYYTEICIRDEYGRWQVIRVNEEERTELLRKLQASSEPSNTAKTLRSINPGLTSSGKPGKREPGIETVVQV